MKMNATEITARREQIKTTRANIKTVVNIYCETSDRTPAETVAAIVERIGYDTAREAIAEIVNTVGEWDGRIWPSSREWAATIETAATRDELEAKSIYQPAEIHPAHINQLAQAMSKYAPPAPQEQEAPAQEAQDTAEIMKQAGALELPQRVALYVPGTQGPAAAADGLRIDYNCRGGESMSSNYKFAFLCVDNGGKHQAFTVSAPNKAAAIEKALKKAEKNAAGDICGRWEIKLQPSF